MVNVSTTCDWKCAICGRIMGKHSFPERWKCFNSPEGKKLDKELEAELNEVTPTFHK